MGDYWESMQGADEKDDYSSSPSKFNMLYLNDDKVSHYGLSWPKMNGTAKQVRPISSPVIKDGKVVDVNPIAIPRSSGTLDMPVTDLYILPGLARLKLARFWGTDDADKGIYKFHFIDHHHPDFLAQCEADGVKPPLTFAATVMQNVKRVVAEYPQFATYYSPKSKGGGDDDGGGLHDKVRYSSYHGLLQCCLTADDRNECSPENPIPTVMILTKTAVECYLKLVLAERPGVLLPEGASLAWLGTREGFNYRFVNGDISDPANGCDLKLVGHKQKKKNRNNPLQRGKKEKAAVDRDGNHYTIELCSKVPLSAEDQALVYVHPKDLFWFPKGEEIRDLILQKSDSEFADFIRVCLRGTYLEVPCSITPGRLVVPVPGAPGLQQNVVNGVQATPPAPAATPAIATQAMLEQAVAAQPYTPPTQVYAMPAAVAAPVAAPTPVGAPTPGFQQPVAGPVAGVVPMAAPAPSLSPLAGFQPSSMTPTAAPLPAPGVAPAPAPTPMPVPAAVPAPAAVGDSARPRTLAELRQAQQAIGLPTAQAPVDAQPNNAAAAAMADLMNLGK